MTTATHPRPQRIRALARAELRQLFRNKLLVYMAMMPAVLPIGTMIAARLNAGPLRAPGTALALELALVSALMFVQFYAVLSMVTTRRDERVLKRLRTGEASDRDIVVALTVPGALLVLAVMALVVIVALAFGAPVPVNVVAVLAAVFGGLVIFAALAFLTSAFTKNAEAAQITSLPVILLAMIGIGTLRGQLPERLADLVDYTPVGAVSDLLYWGWLGAAPADALTDGLVTTDFAGVWAHCWQPALVLIAWTVGSVAVARAYFRWDPRA